MSSTTPTEVPTGKVLPMPFRRPALKELRDAIVNNVYEYHEQISLAEAIGILEIVKQELMESHQ